jgi:hypothetical protein
MTARDYVELTAVVALIAGGLFALYCDMCHVSGYTPFWRK